MEMLYEYDSNFYSDGRSEKIVCQGRKSFIQNFISQEEFYSFFGGYILSENIVTGEEFIGVWGKRKSQSLRRILRERNAEFELARYVVPKFRKIFTSIKNRKEREKRVDSRSNFLFDKSLLVASNNAAADESGNDSSVRAIVCAINFAV